MSVKGELAKLDYEVNGTRGKWAFSDGRRVCLTLWRSEIATTDDGRLCLDSRIHTNPDGRWRAKRQHKHRMELIAALPIGAPVDVIITVSNDKSCNKIDKSEAWIVKERGAEWRIADIVARDDQQTGDFRVETFVI